MMAADPTADLAAHDVDERARLAALEGYGILDTEAERGFDDIVLIAGKGHEPYQEIEGIRHPFDDTAVARQCLQVAA